MEKHRLPSHHQLFAALIPPSPPGGIHTAGDFGGNPGAGESITDTPSSAKDANWRRQLLTLHVIFPSLLLPALDLLDRGLVTRHLVANELQKTNEAAVPAAASLSNHGVLERREIESNDEEPQSHIPDSRQAMDYKGLICMYTVQSAASATSRRRRHTLQTAKIYVVHLDAWSCSCGGFALDAYSNYDVTKNSEKHQSSPLPGLLGNLTLDRLTSLEDFPCCKHLLACLLAEKWRKTPGGNVQDKYPTKEELAAIIGSS